MIQTPWSATVGSISGATSVRICRRHVEREVRVIERVGFVVDLFAICVSVVIGIRIVGLREVDLDFVTVTEAVIVRVGVQWVGAVLVDLFAIVQVHHRQNRDHWGPCQ